MNRNADDMSGLEAVYLYVDESGLPRLTARYRGVFLTTAIRLSDLGPLRRLFGRVRRYSLSKRSRILSEVKVSAASDRFRRALYTGLAELEGLAISTLVVRVTELPYPLCQHEGILYAHMVTGVATRCLEGTSSPVVYLALDRRDTPGLTSVQLTAHLQAGLGTHLVPGGHLEIYHRDSTTDVGLQAADFVSWALYQKYQRNDVRWYEFIASRIISERVLFRP